MALDINQLGKDFNKLDKKYKLLIFSAIPVLTLLIGYQYVYKPKSEQIDTLERKREQLQIELANAQTIENKLKEFQTLVKQKEAELLLARSSLPNQREIPSLLDKVSNLGINNKLDFMLFKPQPESTKTVYAEVPVSIEVSGEFHNTVVFFSDISNLPRLVAIRDIKMGSSQDLDDKTTIKTTCSAVTFMYVEPAK
ncbi:MAG: type 4a pilus biogenesis protein PilO [bacterium]